MRLFGWPGDPGTGYWRVQLPLAELARQGHDVMVSQAMPDVVEHQGGADVLVASRVASIGASRTFQRLAAERRMLCVYETDDDLFSITPDNAIAHRVFTQQRQPVMVQVGFREHRIVEICDDIRGRISANLAAAHLVTTSNATLAAALRQHTDAPIVVLPNRMPRWVTELPEPEHDAPVLTLGYAAGGSHARDFGEAAVPVRRWLAKMGGRAEFHAIGYDSASRVAGRRGTTRHTGWTPTVDAYLRTLDFHVGIAPLRDTEFNRCKTPLKAMECGARAIPVIASAVEPYASYVRHGVTGFLCSTAKDWTAALDALRDPGLRHEMGLAGRLQACEHLVEDHAHDWLDAYTGALNARIAA